MPQNPPSKRKVPQSMFAWVVFAAIGLMTDSFALVIGENTNNGKKKSG